MILKLALRTLFLNKGRYFTALFGVAAAVGLLAWLLAFSATNARQASAKVARETAPYDLWVTGEAPSAAPAPRAGRRPPAGPLKPLPPALLDAVTNAPGVASARALATLRAVLDYRPGGRVMQGPPITATLASLEGGYPFDTSQLAEGRWPRRTPGITPEAVVSEAFFKRDSRAPKPRLNYPLDLVLGDGTMTVKIVGFIRQSGILSEMPSVYTTGPGFARALAQNNSAPAPTLLLAKTGPGFSLPALKARVAALPEPGTVETRAGAAAAFASDFAKNASRGMPLSLTLAFLTAACLLISVLTVELDANRREMALLRTLGLTRGGAVRLLAAETLAFLLPGWLLGLGGAALIIRAVVASSPADFPSGAAFGAAAPAATLAFALALGLAGVLWPLRRLLRIRPLDLFNEDREIELRVSVRRTVLGFLMLFPVLILGLPLPISAMCRSVLFLTVGVPLHIWGLYWILPAFMRGMERLLAPAVSRLLGLAPVLLARRLTRAPGRAMGMILTLAIGLASFSAIHIWGSTLTACYIPSREWPDVIVSVLPNGLSREDAAKAASAKGFRPPVLPIEASQFPLDEATLDLAAARTGARPAGPVLVFGADPIQAYAGKEPLAPFQFLEGTAGEAAKALAAGNACIIPVMLSRVTGLHRGDEIGIAGRKLSIAAVIDLNWHIVTSRAFLRTRFGRTVGGGRPGFGGGRRPGGKPPVKGRRPGGFAMTVGMVFVSEDLARQFTGDRERTYFLWGNLDRDLRKLDGLAATVRLDAAIHSALGGNDNKSALKVHHRDEIGDGILAHGNDIVGAMAQIPFWSLVVLSTGIVSLLLASAQSLRQENRTLRALGLTRGQLGRVFFGEALLVTLAGIALSLICGLCLGWSFTGWTKAWMVAGLPTSLTIPWLTLAKGTFFALGLCAAMALLPLRAIVRR